MDGGAGMDGGDEDEDGGNSPKTRIEMNPLELMAQLDQQHAEQSERNSGKLGPAQAAAMRAGTGQTHTGGPAPLPPPPSGSGRFPHANVPTVVAADAEVVDSDGETVLKAPIDPAHAPTALRDAVSPHAGKPTAMSIDAQPGPSGVAPVGPMSATQYAVNAGGQPHQGAQSLAAANEPTRPSDYPVMAGGQRPYSTDLAPAGLSAPQRSPYSNQFDPQAAANMMSPVGQSYPQTDWERAAAQSAKAMPPWKLAALFIAALGGALLLTIVIAKLFR
jgi:hypothetical protein